MNAIATVDTNGRTGKTQTSDIAKIDATLTADKTKEETAIECLLESLDVIGKKFDIPEETFFEEFTNVKNPTPEQVINMGQDLVKFVEKEFFESTEEAFSDATDKGFPFQRMGITRTDVADIMDEFEDFSLNFPTLVANANKGVQQTKDASLDTILDSFTDPNIMKDGLNTTNLRKITTNIKDFFLFGSSMLNEMCFENKDENENGNENGNENKDDDIRINEEEDSDKEQILYKR